MFKSYAERKYNHEDFKLKTLKTHLEIHLKKWRDLELPIFFTLEEIIFSIYVEQTKRFSFPLANNLGENNCARNN